MPARYTALKKYVASRGGPRLAYHPRLRDGLVDMAVELFPIDAPADRVGEVLAARMRIEARARGVSPVSLLLADITARCVCEWWAERPAHRVLMAGWR